MNRLLAMVVSLMVFLGSPVFAGRTDSGTDSEIEKARAKLTAARQEIDSLLESQANVFDQLEKVEQELELSSRLRRHYRWRIRQVDNDIISVKAQLWQSRQSFGVGSDLYTEHLQTLYKHHSNATPDIFAPNGPSTASRQRQQLGRLIAIDQSHLSTINSEIDGQEELLTELSRSQADLMALTEARQAEEIKAREALQQRERLLASIQNQRRQKEIELADLEAASQLFGDILAQLDADNEDFYFEKTRELTMRMKGRLFWPVQGRVVDQFGLTTERTTGLTMRSSGIKIVTSPGTKVVAAMTGQVVYIGWARGLDEFVVVDHGGKVYSLYGNLGEIAVSEGDQVIRGEPFATAAADRLHFEIREGKSAVDPIAWLKP